MNVCDSRLREEKNEKKTVRISHTKGNVIIVVVIEMP